MASITSANSNFTVKVAGLVPQPEKLQGYATDDAFDTESIELAEVIIGVDGKKSEGFVYALVKMTLMFAASSDSNDLFEEIIRQTKLQRETFRIDGQIIVPATGKVYQCINGTLTQGSIIPNAKKTLQSRQYQITWESIEGAPQ